MWGGPREFEVILILGNQMTNDEEKEDIHKALEKIPLTNVEVIRMEMEVCMETSRNLICLICNLLPYVQIAGY